MKARIEKILSNQDRITQDRDNIICYFAGPRKVLSTSALNGGIRSDLTSVFNHCDKDFNTGYCQMHGDTYEEHLTWAAHHIGLDPTTSCGLSTAADLSYAATCQEHFRGYTVTAICSGGIARNGRRAGDRATMWEQDGLYHVEEMDQIIPKKSGTLNIILHMDADLAWGALTSALMVAVETKTATLMDWKLKSCYSDRTASGSGTDGVIVIADPSSPVHLHHASTDVKLGECIARAVSNAVNIQIETQLRMLAEENASKRPQREK